MTPVRSAATKRVDRGSLPPMSIATRVPKLVERFRGGVGVEGSLDGILVTSLVNIRYLTGFTGSAAMLLVTPDELVFVTDGRYGEQAVAQLGAAGVTARIEVSTDRQQEVVAGAVQAAGIGRLGLEADHVSWAQQRRFATEWFPTVELVPTHGLVEELRRVKDRGEVARIEAAAAIADAALAVVRPRLSDGPTERELALDLDTEIRRLGADGSSFETIVGSGPNGARPHLRPTDRVITAGDLVVLDFGAVVDGYRSDMTRTVIVGGEPDPTQRRMLDVVVRIEMRGNGQAHRVHELLFALEPPGVEGRAVDGVCRSIIADAGWGDAFVHGTGHGVGLQIHEDPRLARTSEAVLEVGNVVTVEPGVYLPEHGGVRIEDTAVVTAEGCRLLTHAPKSPAV